MPSDYEYPFLASDEEDVRRRVGNQHEEESQELLRADQECFDFEATTASVDSSDHGKIWAVILYALTTVLLFADQNLMAPNLSAIANEFGFDDHQRDKKLGGDIALAFFVLGAPVAFVVGCWADQVSNRMVLFGWTVGIGEGACLMTYFAKSYRVLYACRAITGFSMGGALPLIYSVLGDWFEARDRHIVSAVVGVGTGLGVAFGQGLAGYLGPRFGWRLPFVLVSVPALLCAVLVVFTVPEPRRGAQERAFREKQLEREQMGVPMTEKCGDPTPPLSDAPRRHNAASWWSNQDWSAHFKTFVSLLSTRTIVLLLLQGAPGCVPWGIVNTYLNDFLAADRGMSVERATFIVLLFGLGVFMGLVVGGAGGRWLYEIDPRYPSLLSGCMALLGCFPLWYLLNSVDATTPVFKVILVSIIGGFSSGVTGPIVKATLQNVTLPTARGQGFALFNTFDDFGRGLGPVFVALLIDRLGGRIAAFNVGVLGWVLCGTFNLFTFWTVKADEDRMQALFAAMLEAEEIEDKE